MITRREFIKKSGVLAGAGVIGAAIVPVPAEAAEVAKVDKLVEVVKPASIVLDEKVRTLSTAEWWANIPDSIKAQLTEANLVNFTLNSEYPPFNPWLDDEREPGPVYVTASIDFAWTEYPEGWDEG